MRDRVALAVLTLHDIDKLKTLHVCAQLRSAHAQPRLQL